jgi:hypothetical protein
MLKHIWLTPPLAFARVGGSTTPCAAFMWSQNDLTPDGSGQTTLQLTETIELDANGVPKDVTPEHIIFRDEEGIRPVCPFFELHGRWTHNGAERSGLITKAVLDQFNVKLNDITWSVHCTQLKAFHYTYEEGDRIDALLRLNGDDTQRHVLEGGSPVSAKQPLVPKGAAVPFGAVQVARPSAEFPEVRLRFYAPPGLIYGPKNIRERIQAANFAIDANREWKRLLLPAKHSILNPRSAWATFVLERSKLGPFFGLDARNYPNGLFAFLLVGPDADNAESHSLGVVDDVSDGVITCTVKSDGQTLSAVARVVVGPPHFGPTSRPPISIADNLTDRVDRDAARRPERWTLEELRDVVADIFERAFETSDLVHKDYQNSRCHSDNEDRLRELGRTSAWDREDVDKMLWKDITTNVGPVKEGKASAFQLSEGGERKHRRYNTVEYLEMRFRENPELFTTWIRKPLDPNPYFDTRMPALMRGSDTRPWHLTRRQWELMRLWIEKLALETKAP